MRSKSTLLLIILSDKAAEKGLFYVGDGEGREVPGEREHSE